MSVRRRLLELGGTADRRQLLAVTGRVQLEKAVSCGDVVRVGRGRYALSGVEDALALAHGMGGVLSHTSAALGWGWAVKHVPDRPHITVPVKRKVRSAARIHLHRRDLVPGDVEDGRTCRDLTLEQCLRILPFDESLAVADSALRDGYPHSRLVALARDASGPGSSQFRRVAALADERAANPFESVLRAICLGVPGLRVEPQVHIGRARVDLADVELKIVLEADSFEWHGSRKALRRDAHRYNLLVVAGWLVLRFAWEDVMFGAEEVREVVSAAQRRSIQRGDGC